MRVTTILHAETSLAAIADRLYTKLTDSSRKTAESALLKANPNLGRPDGFRPGAIIQVPTLPSLTLKTTDIAQEDPIGHTREILVQAITRYRVASKETFVSNQADIKKQIKLIDQNELTNAPNSRDTPIIGKELKSELEIRFEENKRHHNRADEALGQAMNDLEK